MSASAARHHSNWSLGPEIADDHGEPDCVDQAGHQIGATAGHLLLDRIADRHRPSAQVKFLPVPRRAAATMRARSA
jgi:hypothetical protein